MKQKRARQKPAERSAPGTAPRGTPPPARGAPARAVPLGVSPENGVQEHPPPPPAAEGRRCERQWGHFCPGERNPSHTRAGPTHRRGARGGRPAVGQPTGALCRWSPAGSWAPTPPPPALRAGAAPVTAGRPPSGTLPAKLLIPWIPVTDPVISRVVLLGRHSGRTTFKRCFPFGARHAVGEPGRFGNRWVRRCVLLSLRPLKHDFKICPRGRDKILRVMLLTQRDGAGGPG